MTGRPQEPRTHPRQSPRPPLVLRWQPPDDPLPVRAVRPVRAAPPAAVLFGGMPPVDTGPVNRPFDFCGRLHRLLEDVVRRTPELRHVAVPRILLGYTQARSPRGNGLQARVTPLRFRDGALTQVRRGVTYQVQRYLNGDHEYLYLMTFCLPRFLDQAFDEKFITLFHELYHLSPACDGDLRRHGGRYHLHTHDQNGYDRQMAGLARAYLDLCPDPRLYGFLRCSFAQLHARHGAVTGVVVPRPKIIPLVAPYVNPAEVVTPAASDLVP